jgi:four helix bundle protein
MEREKKRYNLEDRLIAFAVGLSNLVEMVPSSMSGKYLAGQIIRSGFSPALNYGEAQSAESLSDFIHKMKISLKELRETYISLKILRETNISIEEGLLEHHLKECNELISIFVKSIQTAERNRQQKQG